MICMFGLSILGGLWIPVSSCPRTLKTIAHGTPSNRYADMGWHIVAGHGAAAARTWRRSWPWAVVLGAAAVFAYRRATVRA